MTSIFGIEKEFNVLEEFKKNALSSITFDLKILFSLLIQLRQKIS